MTAASVNGTLAALSQYLPERAYRRPRLFRVRARGIEGIPDRYRLQFALMAAERLPGRPVAEAVAVADRLAGRVAVPRRLTVPERQRDLDAWFRGQVPALEAHLDDLTSRKEQA